EGGRAGRGGAARRRGGLTPETPARWDDKPKKPTDKQSPRYRELGPSLRLHARRFYDRRPPVAVGGEECRELLWRGDFGVDAELDQSACDLRRLQARIDGGVEPVDDRAGRAGGRHHAGERDRG